MKPVPFGDLGVVASRLPVIALFLCSVSIGSAAMTERSSTVPSRIRTVGSDEFQLPHGMQLNQVRFLTDGVRTVEIPAGSLLHLPVNGRIRIAKEIVGKMVDWKDFFEANLDVVRQVGASRKVLQGHAQIHPSVSEHLVRTNMLGIAIAAGRPVGLPQPG